MSDGDDAEENEEDPIYMLWLTSISFIQPIQSIKCIVSCCCGCLHRCCCRAALFVVIADDEAWEEVKNLELTER